MGDVRVLAVRAAVNDPSAMREQAEQLRDKLGSAVVVVGAVTDDQKVALVCTVSKELTKRFQAGKTAWKIVDGNSAHHYREHREQVQAWRAAQGL